MKLFSTKLPTIGFTFTIICALLLTVSVYSQVLTVGKSIHNDTSLPLRDMVTESSTSTSWQDGIVPLREIPTAKRQYQKDPVVQRTNGQGGGGTIMQNFDGIPVGTGGIGVAPPDQSMDVGPNHVMEMVNSAYQIWDKNGNSLLGPFTLSNLWAGFPGPWATSLNDGDPVVLYDQAADRWFASEFSLPNGGNGPEYIVIAISATADPTGAWHRYGFEFAEFPDYPHYGIWPDGYYMSVNRFAPNFSGTYTVAFERDQMLNGNAAQYVTMANAPGVGGSFLPSDWDGTITPPAGAPNYFAGVSGGNSLDIFEFHVDWNNTANSTWTGPLSIPIAPYNFIDNIQQLGTTTTLDGLSPRLMHRLQYRNFGTHQAMVTTHNVDAGGDRAGVRWYEVRNTGGGWTLYQQGTYAPADGQERWMGSIAMNAAGDIALGYSVSSSTINPQIRYTGRHPADPLGTMTVTEGTIFAGAGSQTGGLNRWGDYCQMSVDPVDDNTFWFVQEYIPANGSFNWRTRIASFTLGTVVPPAGVLVWEGALGGQDYSGAYINTFLQGAGQTTTYTSAFPASLIGYDAVFLSFGNYGADGSTSTVFDNTMAAAVQAYLEAGGKCYLEGGDALGFDQGGNATLLSLFGISAAADGGTNVIDGLAGQPGAITNGMLFTASTQVNNEFIDQYQPSTGAAAFVESGYPDNVAVQNDGAAGQKTFCFSYALAELTDGAAPSTKNALMTAILGFLLGAPAPPPDISINPTTFTFNVQPDGNDTGTLTISNVAAPGAGDLTFNITDNQAILALSDGTEIPVQLAKNERQSNQGIRGSTLADLLGVDCPWLAANPTNGTIAPGNNQQIIVGVDATGLATGQYNCTLTINSNDPDEPTVNVPVELNVGGGGGCTGTAIADASCNDAAINTPTTVNIDVDMSGVNPPDQLLGSFTATLNYNPALLDYTGDSGLLSGFTGVVNVNEVTGLITFNGANPTGAGGDVDLLNVNFDVIGPVGSNFNLDLEFSAMAAALSFTNLLPCLNVNDGGCTILPPGFLGDVNDDDNCNSTDALIILSFDVGQTVPPDFLQRINDGYGDVNSDNSTNSTDALVILSFDVGINVPFPVCEPFVPNAPNAYSDIEKSSTGKIDVTANPAATDITRGMTVDIPVNIDVSALDRKLGSYTATLEWDKTALEFESVEGGVTKGFENPTLNAKETDKGKLVFTSAVPEGAKGNVNVLNLKLKVIGKSGERSAVKLSFTSMAAAETFENLLPYLVNKDDNNYLVNVGSNPKEYGLDNYPNPFNPTTMINYSLPVAGVVKIVVYNTLGQQVRVLVNQEQDAGQYNVEWNSRNEQNQLLSSGVYILRMEAADFVQDKKLLLIK